MPHCAPICEQVFGTHAAASALLPAAPPDGWSTPPEPFPHARIQPTLSARPATISELFLFNRHSLERRSAMASEFLNEHR